MKYASSILLTLLFATQALGSPCRELRSLRARHRVCWDTTAKAWITEGKVVALASLRPPSPTPTSKSMKNPNSPACSARGFSVEILSDHRGNQQTFCVLEDETLVSASAVKGP